nr:hypothetical protein [uncultured Chitinophaga sp.]
MKKESDRSLCQNRLATIPGFWSIEEDSLNRSSIRWTFLEKMMTDADKLSKEWTIVEVVKTGEKVSLLNYVINYNGQNATVVRYSYVNGSWLKVNERIGRYKIENFRRSVAESLLPSNSYPYDVIITNFKLDSVMESNYHLEHTIADSSNIVRMFEE